MRVERAGAGIRVKVKDTGIRVDRKGTCIRVKEWYGYMNRKEG